MVLRQLEPIRSGSLFFAPMEGITDEAFRKSLLKVFPEWDYLATDFLRVPAAGKYPTKHLVKHFGKELFELPHVQNKTMFQILTSHSAHTTELIEQVESLKIPWLDLNIGCPSNTVCKNRGGSYLLTDLPLLRLLVRRIRNHFNGRFSCKIRIGYHNSDNFEDSVKMLNDEGVELITIHARTRDDMYKNPAKWSYIEKAVKISKVPIIGNGDVNEITDIDRMREQTGCHGVMVARGALRKPWMAQDYKNLKKTFARHEILEKIKKFLYEYKTQLELEGISERGLLKQNKSVTRFMLENIPDGEEIRRKILLTQSTSDFYSIIDDL